MTVNLQPTGRLSDSARGEVITGIKNKHQPQMSLLGGPRNGSKLVAQRKLGRPSKKEAVKKGSEKVREDPTTNPPDARSFEERAFAWFDEINVQFDALAARLSALATQAEQRAFDTKATWDQALKEIIETRKEVHGGFGNFERQLTVLSRDIVGLRADR